MNAKILGLPVRVIHMSQDHRTLYFMFRNGNVGSVDQQESWTCAIGDVFFYSSDPESLSPAPNDIWPDTSIIGVVKRFDEQRVLVDTGLRLGLVDLPEQLTLDVGNTVEISESRKIVKVLWDDPVKFHEVHTADAIDVETYRADPGDLSLDDFAGYDSLKGRISDLLRVSLSSADALQAIGCRPAKGVLFTGPPGTGKTYLCRIIASQLHASLSD